MASAIAAGPLQPDARPPSMLDTLFDVLGNAAGRFDQLTGAGINARDVNSKVMPVGLGAVRVAENVKRAAGSAFHLEEDAVQGLYKRYKNISQEPYPKNEPGIHGMLDRALWQFNDKYSKVRYGVAAAAALKKLLPTHPWVDAASRAGTVFNGIFGPIAAVADAVDTVKDFRHGQWGKAAFHAGKTVFDVISAVNAWRSATFAGARRVIGTGARWLGGRAVAGWNAARTFVTDTAVPWMRNAANATKNFVAQRASSWWNAARTYVTDTAVPWLRNAASVTRNFVAQRAGTAWNAVKGGVRTGWNAARTFVTDRAVPWVTERAIPWVTERAIPWVVEEALPRVMGLGARLGPWGWGAAALAGALWGGYEIYKHPKETQQFLHNAGDFFHNLGAGLTGTAKEKAKSGWHPWADLTASSLKLLPDVFSGNFKGESEDLSGLGHAFNKIRGVEMPPGMKPPPQRTWGQFGWNVLRNGVIGAIPVIGDELGDAVDKASALWQAHQAMPKASRPHVPAPRSRPSAQLRAPSSARSPQPHRQGAGNTPTKTQAEIRVRFDNLPSGKRIDTRAASSSALAETGAQFAF